MSPVPSPRSMLKLNGCFMPGSPAVPHSSAYTDQPSAASVPIDTRVSIVDVPCRRLVHAARWNGQPPWATTGQASARLIHGQSLNCQAGTIASTTTGTVSTTEISSRSRRSSRPPSSRSAPGALAGGGAGGGGGGGVAGRRPLRHQVLHRHPVGVGDAGLLGGEVDRGCHAVDLVQLALDAVGAGGAGHAAHGQLDPGAAGEGRRPGTGVHRGSTPSLPRRRRR